MPVHCPQKHSQELISGSKVIDEFWSISSLGVVFKEN